MFADNSWYFSNALVRANYSNPQKGIQQDKSFLVKFFRNLLLGENNELKNRYMLIGYKDDENDTHTSTHTRAHPINQGDYAYSFVSLKRKNFISVTPLKAALNALILALNDSAKALVALLTKKFKTSS